MKVFSELISLMPSGIITRIFEGRRSKVKEMLSIASTADRKCQMDVALRYYSWAETLMRSLPSPDVVAIAEAKSRRETILKGLNVEFDRQDIYDKRIVELTFTFDGKPVKNIDYKFFDGKTWSKVLSAKDGKGFVEARPDSKIDQYRIKYEITPAHLQHLFREVSLVEKALAPEAEDTDGGTRYAKTHSGPAVTATASESSARKIDFSAAKKKVLDWWQGKNSRRSLTPPEEVSLQLSFLLNMKTLYTRCAKVSPAERMNRSMNISPRKATKYSTASYAMATPGC